MISVRYFLVKQWEQEVMVEKQQITDRRKPLMWFVGITAVIAVVVVVVALAVQTGSAKPGYLIGTEDVRGTVVVMPGRTIRLKASLLSYGGLVKMALFSVGMMVRLCMWLLEGWSLLLLVVTVGLVLHMAQRHWAHKSTTARLYQDRR